MILPKKISKKCPATPSTDKHLCIIVGTHLALWVSEGKSAKCHWDVISQHSTLVYYQLTTKMGFELLSFKRFCYNKKCNTCHWLPKRQVFTYLNDSFTEVLLLGEYNQHNPRSVWKGRVDSRIRSCNRHFQPHERGEILDRKSWHDMKNHLSLGTCCHSGKKYWKQTTLWMVQLWREFFRLWTKRTKSLEISRQTEICRHQ